MDLRNACYRLSQLSHQDLAANSLLLLKTWQHLTNYLRPALKDHELVSDNVVVQSSARQRDSEPEFFSQIEATQDDDDLASASSSSTATRACTNTTVPQVVLSSSDPICTRPDDSIVEACRPRLSKSRAERALKNIEHNARKRQKVLQKKDIQNALLERITEFPPARASSDVSGSKRHSIDRMVWYLEGFFGAMYITEAYHTFQKREVLHRRQRGGKPAKVYEESAASLGIKNSKLARHIKLGDALMRIWSSGHPALLLLVDQHNTLEELCSHDALKLGSWCYNDSTVATTTGPLNASVRDAYKRYQEITQKHWTIERMVLEVANAKHQVYAIILCETSRKKRRPRYMT